MSAHEHWQMDASAPELYERYLVPAITAAWANDLLDRVELKHGEKQFRRCALPTWTAILPGSAAGAEGNGAGAQAGRPHRVQCLQRDRENACGARFRTSARQISRSRGFAATPLGSLMNPTTGNLALCTALIISQFSLRSDR